MLTIQRYIILQDACRLQSAARHLHCSGTLKRSNHRVNRAQIKFSRTRAKKIRASEPQAKVAVGKRPLFSREKLLTGSKRALLFLVPLYVVYGDNEYFPTIPFSIDFMSGPSMLPTIHPVGELYFRNNLSHRLPESVRREWKVGDVVVLLDYKGEYACKRIVGLGGDEVSRYGEFAATRYRNLRDYGVTSVDDEERFKSSPLPKWVNNVTIKSSRNDSEEKVIIPEGYVWVEGDNPIFSIDSRHYGPIPLSNINGRVIFRIWPRNRDGVSTFVKSIRPLPLTRENVMSGNYNANTAKIKREL